MSLAFPSPGYHASMFAGGVVHTAATTRVSSLSVAGVGSFSVAVALALFVIVPGVFGVTRIVTVAFALLLIVPRLQVTGAVPEQEPCDGVDETNVTLTGKVSVSTTLVAFDGPAFETVSV